MQYGLKSFTVDFRLPPRTSRVNILEDEPIGCIEASGSNYHNTLRSIPEVRRLQFCTALDLSLI
jgi:hypothetical protein